MPDDAIMNNLSLCVRNPTIWVPTRCDTNQAVQSQQNARSLKLLILVEEGLYYPCGENKGADQLCSYCTADLHFCIVAFLMRRLILCSFELVVLFSELLKKCCKKILDEFTLLVCSFKCF